MPSRRLMTDPVCDAADLGRPLPDSTHAVSMALPRWRDVVGYEEKSPEVMSRLKRGYPRFLLHPLVEELGRKLGAGEPCLPFPSRQAAESAAAYVQRASGIPARIVPDQDIFGVVASGAGSAALRTFWQHTGLIVSSRQAEAHLAGRRRQDSDVFQSLRRRLAAWYDCGESDVFLTPSGMAAQFVALQTALQRTPAAATAQLGFPYVDTFKLQEKFGRRAILLYRLGSLDARLRSLLQREPLAACFCEIPGNPLLGCADLRAVSPVLREHRVPLVADDVVATPYNIDLAPFADLVATSLTKFIAGSGEAMGGALICNPRSPLYSELKPRIAARHEELLWPEEAAVLDTRAEEFPTRMEIHNRNGLLLAERLRQHPAVERVWYPKWESSDAYEAVRRPQGGWGALITFLPNSASSRAPGIYDRLRVCKGPSLGTVFTLACPFTLLAHYAELDWAEKCGVSRYLIRLSVGLEDPEDLWRRIDSALA